MSSNKCVTLVLLLSIAHGIVPSNSSMEYYSSIMGLESLLKTEQMLLLDIKEFFKSSRLQLDTLESEINKIDKEHEIAFTDTENYLTNPVNVYRLINRLSTDWWTYENRVRYDPVATYFLDSMTTQRKTLNFPSEEDVDGSAAALVRLQETYQLDVSQLAAGILNGVKYGNAMTWQDCFTLGQQLFVMEEYNHTKMWLKESMNRLSKETYFKDVTSLNFMEGVAEHLYQLGDLDGAVKISNTILAYDPNRTKAWNIKDSSESQLENVNHRIQTLTTQPCSYHTTNEFKTYEKVCRGELTASASQLRPLRCRYHTNNHPYRLLAPFKIEEHSLDPLILTFHDIVTDKKINTLKQMATPRMKRSTVRAPVAYKSSKAEFRISKNAWLKYHRHIYMQNMLRDLNDITGLDVTSCEQLQVANYGLGGHYEPHFDFYLQEEEIPQGEGNRIATAIFYFSDVEQGGATAFPFLNIAIKPKKGNVLFWYNLHRSLDGDYRTKHAGCPVLKGSKWIGNVWISDLTQTFTRPCAKYRDNEISLEYEEVK